jgi:DNA-binding response OmpR family regulator
MKKVLIVEDDVMLSEIYKKKFENSGKFEVFLATSGTDAIEKSKKIIPDLILLDLVLPEMDGFEVMRELRKISTLNKTKLVPFSNLSQEDNKKKLDEIKIDGFIAKAEFTPQEIIFEVEKILNKEKPQEDNYQEVSIDKNFNKTTKSDKKILLVDGDDFFLDVFGKKLEEVGYFVKKLSEEGRLLEVLGKDKFFGIILSFELFGSDIKNIILNIKKESSDFKTKILILTNNEEDFNKAKELKVAHSIVDKNKFNPDEFSREIKKILG